MGFFLISSPMGVDLRNDFLPSGDYRRLRNGRMMAAEFPGGKWVRRFRSRSGHPGGVCCKIGGDLAQ